MGCGDDVERQQWALRELERKRRKKFISREGWGTAQGPRETECDRDATQAKHGTLCHVCRVASMRGTQDAICSV